jgi:RluA family pseudouridine synthase
VARTPCIELGQGRDATRLSILYEDRSVMAIDKPAGWLLVPFSWQRTPRNLQAAIASSIAARAFWARSRNLKFLRHVHRLDGDTTGVLLLGKSLGAVQTYGEMFESRRMAKTYLAVVQGVPREPAWTSHARLAPDPQRVGRVVVDPRHGKAAETAFRVLQSAGGWSLVEARPVTGRTHQIRVHLCAAGHPIVGDEIYGLETATRPPAAPAARSEFPLGLRAIRLVYLDPFLRKQVSIDAPTAAFHEAFGFPAGQRGTPDTSGASG